jgi:hypothetical protein
MAPTFEGLGVFYLGKTIDPETGARMPGYYLYDSKDLVTHAVCVGMTGSGKSGMCITLLEEAAIDGIPAVIIDPKGDLANLLLAFPDLSAVEFRPWVSEDAARSRGMTPDEYAAAEAERWRKGLAEWEQDGERIRRFKASADFAVYTPGSTAGLPVSIASSFDAPARRTQTDPEYLRERISTTASGLLGLLQIQADPLRSREHILISKILEQEWTSGRNLDLARLIQSIQSPSLQRVGIFDLETFYPRSDRMQLAMMLNNLLAAPGFATWLEGEPLDIGRMLHTEDGKPRMTVFSIAHLPDSERMFFVTMLLNQTVGWMRSQPGTTSLRAILYMDEIFGFFPPVAEPPSKRPLLTLLKQARAYGLGVVLASQNPVDLDYKGLANTGTWFVGRLQTERDRERLLDGLSSAASGGAAVDRANIARMLANLPQRSFLVQNAHEDHPVLLETRWSLSYLAGPLTRGQIKSLMDTRRITAPPQPQAPAAESEAAAPAPEPEVSATAPHLPAQIRQLYSPGMGPLPPRVRYQPMLYASAKFQIINNAVGIALSRAVSHTLELQPNMTAVSWDDSRIFETGIEELCRQPVEGATYLPLPTSIFEPKRLGGVQRAYLDFVYRQSQVTLWKSAAFKATSQPGESERDFRIRLQQTARERRDFELDRLRQRYAPKIKSIEERSLRAQERVEQEQAQYSQQKIQTAISVGATILGALMGRKVLSTGTLGRATTATRQASRIAREKDDIDHAREEQALLQRQLDDLNRQLQQEADALARSFDPQSESLRQVVVRPTKSDILVQTLGVLWVPTPA